jgi:putative transposase
VKHRSDTICPNGALNSLLELQSKTLTYSKDQIRVPEKSYHFTLDFSNDAYYGDVVNANKEYVINSKMKDSTTTCYSFILLYLITKGQWLTIAFFR